MADLEPRHEPGERDLRGVGSPAEHRFAEKGTPQFDPVQATGEGALAGLVVMPAFDRMGVARGVEVARRLLNGAVDPRFAAIGAGADDVVERGVMGNGEAPRAQPSPERARTMEAIKRENRALARLDPEDLGGVAAVGHRENPRGIALEQQAGIEHIGHRRRTAERRRVRPSSSADRSMALISAPIERSNGYWAIAMAQA